jgi:hypothetical protein
VVIAVELPCRDVLVEPAEDAALVDGRARAEGEAVEVVELELVGRAADAAALQRPGAAAPVPRPDAAPDLGGDVAGALRRMGWRRGKSSRGWRGSHGGLLGLRLHPPGLRPDAAALPVPLDDEVEAELEDGVVGRARV